MRRSTLLVLLVSALFLGGCTKTGTISGTVKSLTTGRPIEGVIVRAGSLESSTTSQGAFSFAQVPYGSVTVVAEKDGYPTARATLELKAETKDVSLTLEDARLAGHLVELAVEPSTITSVAVMVGEATATVDADGNFALAGLKSGMVAVKVTDAIHEPYSGSVDLKSGDNTLTANLSLTAQATYQRYSDAYLFRHYDRAYRYLHPDIKRKDPGSSSLEKYTETMQQSLSIASVKMVSVRVLPKWTSKIIGNTYWNVVEIDRTLTFASSVYGSEGGSQHWIKEKDGIWYCVYGE